MFWHWVRRQYRIYGRPLLPIDEATKVYNITSLLYFFSCWTIAGMVFVSFFRKKQPEVSTESSAEFYGSMLGIKKMEVIHLKGFKNVGASEFDLKEFEDKIKKEKLADFFGETETEVQR